MNTVIADFEKRVNEIELYYKLIDSLVDQECKLFFENKRTHKYKTIDGELKKVIKANSFLMLYNLMESSIRLALEELYESISNENITFNDVTSKIKSIWIKVKYRNFKDQNSDSILSAFDSIANDVISMEFTSSDISGNIDGRKVRDFSNKIGFSSRVHYTLQDGSLLVQVKQQRNSLAHGNLSFSECGRNYSIPDLVRIKNQVVKYLRKILLNIKDYIDSKNFLQ